MFPLSFVHMSLACFIFIDRHCATLNLVTLFCDVAAFDFAVAHAAVPYAFTAPTSGWDPWGSAE